jgi:putative restriction endonuclease
LTCPGRGWDGSAVKAFVALTDGDWFSFLSSLHGIDEVNFWQPSGGRAFRVLEPGEPLLFKLHAPYNAIAGGGFFAGHSVVPASLAWESFGEKNGATSFPLMMERIERYVRHPVGPDHPVGCILLEQPFFWTEDQWIQQPDDWKSNIVSGKTYDLAMPPIGSKLWEQVQFRLITKELEFEEISVSSSSMFGEARLVRPRLGQGSFRILVTDACERRCAVTGEKILPVLQAAHIRPVASGGQHQVQNGLLLRSDFHTLFDRGYLTVTPDLQLRVSRQLRETFKNGAYYYGFEGQEVRAPAIEINRPSVDSLEWHSDTVFRR